MGEFKPGYSNFVFYGGEWRGGGGGRVAQPEVLGSLLICPFYHCLIINNNNNISKAPFPNGPKAPKVLINSLLVEALVGRSDDFPFSVASFLGRSKSNS